VDNTKAPLRANAKFHEMCQGRSIDEMTFVLIQYITFVYIRQVGYSKMPMPVNLP